MLANKNIQVFKSIINNSKWNLLGFSVYKSLPFFKVQNTLRVFRVFIFF